MDGSCLVALHMHHGSLPEVRRIRTTPHERREVMRMAGFHTISPIFAVFFAVAGLALAVNLGMLLYPDKKQKSASTKKSVKVREEAETV